MNNDYINPRPRIRTIKSGADISSPGRGSARRLVAEELDSASSASKRKANRTSWQTGQSGNPAGRKPGSKGLKATTRSIMLERVEVQPGKKMPLFEALLRQEAQAAAKGDWRARATMFALARWAIPNEPDAEALAPSDPNLSESGRAILEWFAQEVRAEDAGKGADDAPLN